MDQAWSAEHLAGTISRPLRSTGEPYSGINVILLWAEAVARGYSAPIWITFRQALALGAHVRKGEHGATVVYANRITRTEAGDDGQDVERQIPFLKAYTVFNVDQVDGLPAHFYAVAEPKLDAAQRIDHADAFFAAAGADVRHGGNQAYYAMHPDYVQMPPFECFEDPEAYYATLAHECTHDAERRTMPHGRGASLAAADFRPVMGRHKICGAVPDSVSARAIICFLATIQGEKTTGNRPSRVPPKGRRAPATLDAARLHGWVSVRATN